MNQPSGAPTDLYGVNIDPSNLNTSHAQVLDLVGDARRVLDVGCWTGDLGRVLTARGARVSGVEIDEPAAAIAREHLEEVVVADLDRTLLSERFAAGSFDAIVFADVLEHLFDPLGVLTDAVPLLSPGGHIVISVPNVSHGSVRLALLQGRWRTTDTGLLDRTHIRFFTRDSLAALVESAGLSVADLRGTLADPLGTEVDVDVDGLPDGVAGWLTTQPDALVYQFQLAATAVERGDAPTPVPDLVPGVDVDEVRPGESAIWTAQVEWRRRLVAVDKQIAVEASVDAAAHQAAYDARRIAALRDERDALLEKVAKANQPAPTLRRRLRSFAGRVKRRLLR